LGSLLEAKLLELAKNDPGFPKAGEIDEAVLEGSRLRWRFKQEHLDGPWEFTLIVEQPTPGI
jgi:hypothetical protein